MPDNNLIVAGLDFAAIKENLKTYLKNNSDFTDYDFEGSALSTLINLLSYNTQYNAFYLNMVANDAFLDTAVKRSSILSLAQSLGYVPISSVGARATVNITVELDDVNAPNQAILESTDRFQVNVDGINYPLYPISDYSTTRELVSGSLYKYTFSGVELRQGTPLQTQFIVTGSPTQKFILPNNNIDVNTIQVKLYDNVSSTAYTVYNKSSSIVELTGTSEVFFIKENENGYIEIYFGDGIIGKSPQANNLVSVNYNVVDGNLPNGATNIEITDGYLIDELEAYGISSGTINGGISVVEPLNGGKFSESEFSIKLRAPRNYAGQERAVTSDDYKFFVEQVYPNVDSIRVWGGQDNVPPQYGKVFISIKPEDGLSLNQTTKNNILSNIKKRNIISIVPEIVDVDFTYLIVNSLVKFDSRLTSYDTVSLANRVKDNILAFRDNYLDSFDRNLRYSKFVSNIDSVDTAINSNITTLRLKKLIEPERQTIITYTALSGSIFSNQTIQQPQAIGTTASGTISRHDAAGKKIYISNTTGIFNSLENVTTITGTLAGETFEVSTLQQNAGYQLDFQNAIKPKTVSSSLFNATSQNIGPNDTNLFLTDDGSGTLQIVRYDNNGNLIIVENVGSVDYSSGIITIISLDVDAILDGSSFVKVFIQPEINDIFTYRNTILTVLKEDVTVEAQVDNT